MLVKGATVHQVRGQHLDGCSMIQESICEYCYSQNSQHFFLSTTYRLWIFGVISYDISGTPFGRPVHSVPVFCLHSLGTCESHRGKWHITSYAVSSEHDILPVFFTLAWCKCWGRWRKRWYYMVTSGYENAFCVTYPFPSQNARSTSLLCSLVSILKNYWTKSRVRVDFRRHDAYLMSSH